ncbi:MAG: hypothetical protein JNL01_00200 [Bdellovibrionales bacterium]|nr:hypothetical protein [Bdellovibrionales bacterium]
MMRGTCALMGYLYSALFCFARMPEAYGQSTAAFELRQSRAIPVIRAKPDDASVIIKPRPPEGGGRGPASLGSAMKHDGILDLQLNTQDFPISFEAVADRMQPSTELTGRFTRPDWNLVIAGEKVPLEEDGSFRKRVPLEYGDNQLKLYAVGPLGKIESQTIDIGEVDENKNKGRGASNIFLTHGLSFSQIRYEDTRLAQPLLIHALTAKLSYVYLLSSRWDVSGSAYFTAVRLSSTSTDNTRFFGANGRLAYGFMDRKAPWQFSLGAGLFYSTMITPNGGYGFNDVVGPQVLPVLKRVFSKGNSIGLYGKGAMITGGWEVAGGLNYAIPLSNGRSISLSVDYSRIDLVIEAVQMRSNSISFGAGFTL